MPNTATECTTRTRAELPEHVRQLHPLFQRGWLDSPQAVAAIQSSAARKRLRKIADAQLASLSTATVRANDLAAMLADAEAMVDMLRQWAPSDYWAREAFAWLSNAHIRTRNRRKMVGPVIRAGVYPLPDAVGVKVHGCPVEPKPVNRGRKCRVCGHVVDRTWFNATSGHCKDCQSDVMEMMRIEQRSWEKSTGSEENNSADGNFCPIYEGTTSNVPLTPAQLEAATLFAGGMTYEQIAERLGIQKPAAFKLVKRANARLAAAGLHTINRQRAHGTTRHVRQLTKHGTDNIVSPE